MHAGRRLAAGNNGDCNWRQYSFVHAAVFGEGTAALTVDNAAAHPVVALRVVQDSKQAGGGADQRAVVEDAAAAGGEKGLVLHIHDASVPMGNGAFGAVFKGTVHGALGRAQWSVAVKKFFMLEQPLLYGFANAAAVLAWVERDLLPEINVLAGLAHPNVVRLRGVGLAPVHGVTVPAYVAMDLCDGGTLEHWLRDDKLTDVCVVGFLSDMVDGMLYLHDVKRIVHRDIKPDNLFVRVGLPSEQRPTLVIGDVGLAKKVTRTVSMVSAAGAVAYRAPEAMVDAARCSAASDVYTASLVAVELVTGQQVYGTCGDDVAAKRGLTDRARAQVSAMVEFADDSTMTVAATDVLLSACTIADVAARPTFRAIAAARDTGVDGAGADF